MGWILDAISSAVSWVVDVIFRPFMNWVIGVVNWITAELKAIRHDVVKAIAKWLNNDFAFLLTVIAAVVIAVCWPAILAQLKKISSLLLNSAIVITIKETALKLIDVNKLIDLVFLNTVLKIIWPDYLAITSSFAGAVSALADELGEGSGYIHAYFAAQRGIVFGTNALIGNPPELAEMAAYNDTSAFLKKIDDRFRRYAHDPGLIVRDFLEEILIPAAEEQRDAQQALVSDVRENYDRVVSQEEGLKLAQDSLNKFIKEMPDEIASQILLRWTPINNKLNEWVDFIDTQIIPKINGIITAAEERAAYQNQINAYAKEKISDPLNNMLNYELATSSEQVSIRDHYLKLLAEALGDEIKAGVGLRMHTYDQTFSIITNLARTLPGPLILQYEPPGFAHIPTGPASPENWFIGEY